MNSKILLLENVLGCEEMIHQHKSAIKIFILATVTEKVIVMLLQLHSHQTVSMTDKECYSYYLLDMQRKITNKK